MLTLFLLILCGLMLFYMSYQYAVYRPKGFPPGPPRIPLFGSYLFMMLANFKYLHKGVLKFSKWYNSDIIGFYMGSYPVVAVHSGEGIREILNRQEFDGRPRIYLASMRDPIKQEISGIFFEQGHIWKEQRRFFLRHLRDFGFGRRFDELELIINEELNDILDLIRYGPRYEHEKLYVAEQGMCILLPYFFSPFTANSFFHIMCNERWPRSEQADIWKLIRMGMQFQRTADDYGKMLSIMPWLRFFCSKLCSYDSLMESNTYLYTFFEKIINRHFKNYDNNDIRIFLDLYIKEMQDYSKQIVDSDNKTGKNNQAINTFTRTQFVMSMIDFALPSFTAISTQLSFLIQYVLLYPDVQKRIQIEIDNVLGEEASRLPTLEDRKNMHYTEATLREILRIETLVPSDIPHKTLIDTELMGYKIPKETIIIPSLYAYHNDTRIWGDPEEFRPERFLDEKGNLCLRKDVSLPFGAGKRLCAGETFARNMLFLITATLFQNFSFVVNEPKSQLPNLSTNLSGLITSPKDFWVHLIERKFN